MKSFYKIIVVLCLLLLKRQMFSQSNNPAPYGGVSYVMVPCNQTGPSNTPGNFINDFINTFTTSGASNNIVNVNSGCNGLLNNYIYYNCQHYLSVVPGQTVTCNLQSGITFAQGFAIFIDWNQDNVFNLPNERVAATISFPAAGVFTTIAFVVPFAQANGTYRMRVRGTYVTPGTIIDPYQNYTYGETEDYNVYVGFTPSGVLTASSPSSLICAGQSMSLNASFSGTGAVTYTWTGPNSFTSNVPSPLIVNSSPSITGTYSVSVNTGACIQVQTVSVTVIPYPSYTVTPLISTICQGGSFSASVSLPFGIAPASYNYSWSPTHGGLIFNPQSQSTIFTPSLLPVNVQQSTLVYTVSVTPKILNCPVLTTMAVIINNPLTPTLTMPPPQCNTFNPYQLIGSPPGGTWTANNAVSPGGLLNPALAAISASNTVNYVVSVGNCTVSNTGTFSVSKFNTPALTSTITVRCVQDPPFNLMTIVQNTTGIWSGFSVQNNFFTTAGLPSGIYSLTYNTYSDPDSSACPASTVLAVQVFNPPTPVISQILDKCNTSPPTTLVATPPGGIWTQNSGVNSLGIQTPSLCPIGNSNVLYTAGLGTCVASASASFHVSKFNSAAFTGTVPNFCFNHPPFNLMGVVQNTNGSWTGANVTGNLFSPGGLPTFTFPLIYNTFSSPNPLLCPDSNTLIASVLNPPSPNIVQAGPFCSKDAPIQMNVTPNTGYWNATSYLTANGVLIPSLCAVGNNVIKYTIGTNTCNVQQTKTVQVEAFVPAIISNQIPDLCNTSSVFNLLPLTINNLGSWSGPGVTGANFVPSITGAGNYVLHYNTSSSPSGLCPDAATVAVRVFSLASPQVTKIGPFCNTGSATQINVSPIGGIFGGANNSAISASGMFNPAMANIGNNVVNYSVSSGPCIAYAQTTVEVEKFISAGLDKYPDFLCKNSTAVNLDALVQNPGGQWTCDNPSALVGSLFHPSKASTGVTQFIYRTMSSINNPLLCPDASTIQIKVQEVPTVRIESNTLSVCAPFEVFLYTPSVNNGKGVWSLGDGSEQVNGLYTSHIFTTPGTYTVAFNYFTEEGCATQALLDAPIVVHESPKADFIFESEEVLVSNPEVYVQNLSTVLGNNKYQWFVTGAAQPDNSISPRIQFPGIGNYNVTLLATTQNGCKDAVTKSIEVKNDFNVFIPTSFTPNSDGLNDVFMPVFSPYGIDAKTYEMEIFDRWGKSIFRTKDISKGWDGSSGNKGDTMKQDNYVYKIMFKDITGKLYNRTGHLTLLNR